MCCSRPQSAQSLALTLAAIHSGGDDAPLRCASSSPGSQGVAHLSLGGRGAEVHFSSRTFFTSPPVACTEALENTADDRGTVL